MDLTTQRLFVPGDTGTPPPPPGSGLLAVACNSSPTYLKVYPFSSTTGFGTAYTIPAFSTGTRQTRFTKDGSLLIVSNSNALNPYQWSSSGIGSALTSSATYTTTQYASTINPAETVMAVCGDGSPYINLFAFSKTTGVTSQYTSPSIPTTVRATAADWNADGTVLFVTQYGTPHINAYVWNDVTGAGTKYSNPATLPSGISTACAASRQGASQIFVGNSNSSYGVGYPFNIVTGFGARFSTTGVSSNATYMKTAPVSNVLAVSMGSSPYLACFQIPTDGSTGFGTKFANPASLPASTANCVDFNVNEDAVAIATNVSPFVEVYQWSPSGFGSKFSAPSSFVSGSANAVSFV